MTNVRRLPLALLLGACLTISARAAVTAPTSASQIPNLDTVKDEVRAYYTSGNYEREASRVTAAAQAYVDAALRAHPKRPAVVMDVDDTVLSDYGYESSHDFGYDPRSYDADVEKEAFPAIAPTLAFVRHVKAEGVAIIYVTGRRTSQRAVTLQNLVNAGFPWPDGLMLRPVSDHARSIVPFKSHARAQVQAEGYTVLLSMGDQWSDLRGGHALRDFKLPNPMYFIP